MKKALLILVFTLISCAPADYIKIGYPLPAAERRLANVAVCVSVLDRREDKTTLTDRAREDFSAFSGIFALYLKSGEKEEIEGTHDITGLFKAVFEKRLALMGADVLKSQRPDAFLFEVTIKEAQIDILNRTWRVKMSYEVRLFSGENLLAVKQVSGSAQRIKITGTSDAEKVLGELFNDVVNRLDIADLFKSSPGA